MLTRWCVMMCDLKIPYHVYFSSTGLLTNVIVVFVMLKSKALMKIESIKFIVNQSLIDALTSFLIITSHMNLVDYLGVVQDNYKDNNLADEVLCRYCNK